MIEDVYRWAVVGTGIHGTFLIGTLVRDLGVNPASIVAIDPHGEHLAMWRRRAANTTMHYLRSPASHALDPDLRGLRRFARKTGRNEFTPVHKRPSLALFDDYARATTDSLMASVVRRTAEVREIVPDGQRYHVVGDDISVRARSVLLAPGQPPPLRPPWATGRRHPVSHIYDDDFSADSFLSVRRVAIVGGGIGAAHLALGAIQRGARVTTIVRDPRSVHRYDSDPCYIGPRCGDTFAAISSNRERRERIRAERRSGSVTPDIAGALEEQISSGALMEHRDTVLSVSDDGEFVVEGEAGRYGPFDALSVATGFAPGPPAAGLVWQIARDFGAPLSEDGFPIPDHSLRWTGNIYVSGALADLEVGPPARNIIGAHITRRRMLGIDPGKRRFADRTSAGQPSSISRSS